MGPWEAALGDRASGLHPQLRTYFSTIPAGSVGRGAGVFSIVGTPRRWLWPFLSILARDGVIFPVWEHDVPFVLENRPTSTSVDATITFRMSGGDRVMFSTISANGARVIDRLGRRRRVATLFDVSIEAGTLRLHPVGVQFWRVRVPSFLAPRVALTESFNDDDGLQHLTLTLDAPVVGRIYEYAGSFSYRIEPE